jgi:phenylpropionate dioxygenase-like ring-hydroxylating dioxygenase large terminal subunit
MAELDWQDEHALRALDLDEELRAIVADVAASTGDVAQARSMPPAAYTSERFYEFEKDAVFGRSWLFLCHVSQIPKPGDSHLVTLAGEPLIVVRGAEGEIRVMSAVCQHRAHVIPEVDKEVMRLRCPYHYWTYNLDGSLHSAPSMRPAHDLDQLRATIALPTVRVEVWEGLVFANLDPDAEPLAPTLAFLAPHVTPFRIADLRVAETMTFADLPFNWKNMQENALEEYHTTYVHRGYHERAPARLVRHHDYAPGDGAVYRHAGLLIPSGAQVPNRPFIPAPPGLPEELYHDLLFMAIPPLQFAAVEATGIKMFRITPQSASRTTLTITWLYPQPTIELPDFPDLMKAQLELVDVIDQPDLEVNTSVYRGLQSRFAQQGPYSPQEASLPQFNQWCLERYLRPLPARAAACPVVTA